MAATEHIPAALWQEPELRRRVVRLCARVSGDASAAEDLAQETLLEAWRHQHKLYDPAGADRWLAAIARNVCRRWARGRGRGPSLVPISEEPAADVDLEVELERAELVVFVDRALALLPPETREVVVCRYLHESSHAEIGARLGISADAVSMRLTRGKALLQRLLAAELGRTSDDAWRETRVWCTACGRSKLRMRLEPAPGAIAFRCQTCTPRGTASEFALGNPCFARLLGGLVRPTAILARAADWSRRYFAGGAAGGATCTRCDRPVRIERYFHDSHGRRSDGLYAACGACGEQVSSSAGGIALALPEVRQFIREHPRSRALPQRDVEIGGVAATVVRRQDALGSAGVEVVFARGTLRLLRVARD